MIQCGPLREVVLKPDPLRCDNPQGKSNSLFFESLFVSHISFMVLIMKGKGFSELECIFLIGQKRNILDSCLPYSIQRDDGNQ